MKGIENRQLIGAERTECRVGVEAAVSTLTRKSWFGLGAKKPPSKNRSTAESDAYEESKDLRSGQASDGRQLRFR